MDETELKYIDTKIKKLEESIESIKNKSTQPLLDKMTDIVCQKLNDRDKIIDLELKNISHSIKLDIQTFLKETNNNLEKKMDEKINYILKQQRDRVSWGIEIMRFFIMLITFILSIKIINT